MERCLLVIILLSCLLWAQDKDKKSSPENNPGTSPPRKEAIWGTWSVPEQRENGVVFQTKLSFYQRQENFDIDTVHEVVTCSKGLHSLQSQAEASAKTTKNDITILNKAFHEEREGNMVCQAVINPGVIRYSISSDGRTMVLTTPGQAPLSVKRDTPTD